MRRTIVSSRLTTCEIIDGGEAVRLDLLDPAGEPVSVQFPFDHAQALVMTLPQLLSEALRTRLGSADARFVFPLGQWSVENGGEPECLIVTLRTTDGFEVAFGIPHAACRSLGWALKHEATLASADAPADSKQVN